MNMYLYILSVILFSLGLFSMLQDFFFLPSKKSERVIRNLSKKEKKKDGILKVLYLKLVNKVAKKIRIKEERKKEMEEELSLAKIKETPEMYLASNILKASCLCLCGFLCLFFSKLLGLVCIFCSILLYFLENNRVKKKLQERRKKIEEDLPSFVSHICKSLESSHDIYSILCSYKPFACVELCEELEKVTGEMQTGGGELSLIHMEDRVSSSYLSDVTRGLIAVYARGDVNLSYWETLHVKFEDLRKQVLKEKAMKAPKKVRKLSLSLLCCFMLTYVVVIGEVLLSSLGGLFS